MRTIKSLSFIAILVALFSMFGCSGGGGSTSTGGSTGVSTPQNTGPGYTLKTGELGISSPQFLSYTSLSKTTVGWGKQFGAYGTIAFGDKSTLNGTLTASSPAINAAMIWKIVDGVITVTTATSPVLVYTYSPLAVNASADYYVMVKSQMNADGSVVFVDYERWYIGTGAAAAAQLYALTVPAFTTDLVSGKKLQNISISSPLWTGNTGASPFAVALDTSGGIYVVNYGSNTVQKFTTASSIPVWTGITDQNPIAVAVDANGGIYVVNSNQSPTTNLITVQKFTTASSAPVGSGTISGTFPNSIAVDASGSNIYVTCAQSNTLVKFPALAPPIPPATTPPATTPTWSVTTGQNPAGVALDAAGAIYVTNYADNTVQKFNSAGVSQWSSSTSAGPSGVTADAGGGVYVTCATANVVQKFTSAAGALLWTGTTGLKPDAVAVDASGGIFVTSAQSNTVQKFTTAATTPVWTGNTGTLPSGVAVDASGGIFVTSYGSSTVQKFTVTGYTTVYSFLANGTFTSTVTPGVSGGGTWVVNSDGTLTLTFINPSSSTTFTVQSGSTITALILNAVNSNGSTVSNLTMTYI